jgi:hypothetical protein
MFAKQIAIIGGGSVESDDQQQSERIFNCLKCGHITQVVADPPRCERCNTGAGIVSENSPKKPQLISSDR